MFGSTTEKCWVCTKSIYPADRQLNFNGKIHTACAKCKDCSSSLTVSNAFRVKDYGGDDFILCCKTHNAERLKHKSDWRAPTVEKIESIMTPAMERALAASKEKREAAKAAAPPKPVEAAPAPTPATAAPAPATAASAPVVAPAVKVSSAPVPSTGLPKVPPKNTSTSTDAAAAGGHSTHDPEINSLVNELKAANEGGDGDTQLATFWEISNLSKDESKMKMLANPKLGLLSMLAKIISEDTTGDSRIAAIGVLWNLSVSADNRVEIIKPDVGLVAALVNVLDNDVEKIEAKNRALGVLHNVSLSQEAQPKLGESASETGLLKTLVNLMQGPINIDNKSIESLTITESDVIGLRDRACGVLWNLSTCSANRALLAAQPDMVAVLAGMLTDTNESIAAKALIIVYYLTLAQENRLAIAGQAGLVPGLVALMKDSAKNKDRRVKICGIFVNLSSAAENKAILADADTGLLEALIEAILDSGPSGGLDLRNKACGVLWNISVLQSNRERMAVPELGLLRMLVEVIKAGVPDNAVEMVNQTDDKSRDESVMKCCVIAQNLAGAKECHENMIESSLGLITALATTIYYGKDDAKQKAFGAVVNMSLSEATQEALGQNSALVGALLSLLKSESAGENRSRACGVLQNLAVSPINRLSMLADNDKLKLAAVVIGIIKNTESLRNNALGLFLNLSVAPENKPIVGASVGLVEALSMCIADSPAASDVRLKACSLAWSLGSNEENRSLLAAHQPLLDALTAVAGEESGDIQAKAMGALGTLAPGLSI